MEQLYFENTSNSEQLKPRKEKIRFLLDYSKSLKIITTDRNNFEILVN
jgi:hypothetical protein